MNLKKKRIFHFIEKYKIDYVVHGFSNPSDKNKQNDFFEIPIMLNKFIETPYYHDISTTDIINKIKLYNN